MTAAAKRIISIEKDQWSKAYQTALVVLLRDRIRLLIGVSPVEQQKTMDFIKTFLTARSEKAIRVEDVRLAAEACRTLERFGHLKLAAKSYSDFAEVVARTKDEALAVEVAMFEGAVRRLGLTGKPLELRGTTKDGTLLDWSAYRGKTVLVTCIDPEHEALKKLLAKEELPWSLIQRGDAKTGPSPVVRLGVTNAPVSILVDKQGVVASVTADRHRLGQLLEQQIGLPPYGVNLLKNGGFEGGLADWETDHATMRSRNPLPHNGTKYLFGSTDGSRASYTKQETDLVGKGFPEDKIDAGALTVDFGGWQAGFEDQRDSGKIEVIMRDSSKAGLARKDLGWFYSNHRWVLKEGSVNIVSGTRFIEYGFHAKYYDGARNMDAYLDDAYLIVNSRTDE